jgi:acetyl-CoA hydrolase
MNFSAERLPPIPIDQFDFNEIIRPGDTIGWPQAIGEPLGLTGRLVAQRDTLPHPRLFFGMGSSRTLVPEMAESFTFTALNGAGTNRRISSLCEIIPAHVSAIPRLLRTCALPLDVVLIRARRLPDGRFTTGPISDFTQAMVAAARVVIAELDERLPITGQDAVLPADNIHHLVAAGPDEVLMPDPEPSEIETAVAAHVADMIPNGATVQLGVGTLPVAVARALVHHRDLGIHSGVISDSFVTLMNSGAISNARKGIDAGLSVTGGLFGTRVLLDHASGNPAIAMRNSEHTHSQAVMAQLHAMHSINSALEIDLTGQVNAEAIGGRYLGAVGGQPDFVRGAQLSPGGRSIIALPSTTPDGRHSRIVASLGGPVTTARSDVDVVITEYGVADLRACFFTERARRLIAIAHPDFREDLRRQARRGA